MVGEEDFGRGVLKPNAAPVRVANLKHLVAYICRSYGLDESQLAAHGRARVPAEARAVVAWLALKSHAASLSGLAQLFGRDLSTLSHAVSRVEKRVRDSKAFDRAMTQHLNAIKQA